METMQLAETRALLDSPTTTTLAKCHDERRTACDLTVFTPPPWPQDRRDRVEIARRDARVTDHHDTTAGHQVPRWQAHRLRLGTTDGAPGPRDHVGNDAARRDVPCGAFSC